MTNQPNFTILYAFFRKWNGIANMAKKSDWIIGGLIIFGFFFVILFFVMGIFGISSTGNSLELSGSKVGLVELEGVILDSRKTVHQIERMRDSDGIRAIVLRVDTPGGGVAASQEIYEAVKSVRESDKPVVVSMGSVAASGGYYVACGADSIIANPGTTTGSIGVIMEIPNFKGLFEKIGVRFNVIKSGKFKDIGSPYRDMTSAEKAQLQQYIDDAYRQFVEVVMENRDMDEEKVLSLADGRVFTGKQALEIGLVDLLGDYGDAIRIAAEMAGLKGKPKTYRFPKKKFTLFDVFFGDLDEVLKRLDATPALKYQFTLEGLFD